MTAGIVVALMCIVGFLLVGYIVELRRSNQDERQRIELWRKARNIDNGNHYDGDGFGGWSS